MPRTHLREERNSCTHSRNSMQRSESRAGRFTFEDRIPDNHSRVDCVSPSTDLTLLTKDKPLTLSLIKAQFISCPASSPVAVPAFIISCPISLACFYKLNCIFLVNESHAVSLYLQITTTMVARRV